MWGEEREIPEGATGSFSVAVLELQIAADLGALTHSILPVRAGLERTKVSGVLQWGSVFWTAATSAKLKRLPAGDSLQPRPLIGQL